MITFHYIVDSLVKNTQKNEMETQMMNTQFGLNVQSMSFSFLFFFLILSKRATFINAGATEVQASQVCDNFSRLCKFFFVVRIFSDIKMIVWQIGY